MGDVVLEQMKQLAERWWVYILRCADGSLYTGIAKDADRRLVQHNAGKASRYTRSRLPVTLEYREGGITSLTVQFPFEKIASEGIISSSDDEEKAGAA